MRKYSRVLSIVLSMVMLALVFSFSTTALTENEWTEWQQNLVDVVFWPNNVTFQTTAGVTQIIDGGTGNGGVGWIAGGNAAMAATDLMTGTGAALDNYRVSLDVMVPSGNDMAQLFTNKSTGNPDATSLEIQIAPWGMNHSGFGTWPAGVAVGWANIGAGLTKAPGDWVRIEVVVVTGSVKVYADGNLVYDLTNATTSGFFGIGASSDALITAANNFNFKRLMYSFYTAPVPSVTIDFSDPYDLIKYFEVPADSLGTWEVMNGQLVQTTERATLSGLDALAKQFITLRGQTLLDYTIQFDYQVCTLEEYDEGAGGFAKYVLLATNVPDGSVFSNTDTNGGYGYAYADFVSSGGNKKFEMGDLKGQVDNILATTSIAVQKKQANFEPAGIHTIKIVKTGKDIQFYQKNSLMTDFAHYNDVAFASPILDAAKSALMVYETAGAVQFVAGNGIVRLDNITVTSPQLLLSNFPDPTSEATATPTAAPTTAPTTAPSSETSPETSDVNVLPLIVLAIAASATALTVFSRKAKQE